MDKLVKDSKGSYEPVIKVKDTHHKLLKRIGIELEERRKEKNISVTTLCDKVGISRTTYYRIKEGMIYFNIQKMLDLLDELDTSVIINFKDNNTTEQA
jgi:transcriptional regulator with XRE-family HTH domain